MSVYKKIIENKNEPNDPEIVFCGLILVSLGPLNILPKINPPTSDATQVNKIIKNNIFK
tara:strand:+ start:60 stop:236 length:177 start_codon:yes stop_codon:yes gene_type:complete